MAKYLRPRRGSKDSAFAQKILLKKGEVFLEFPNSEIGRGPGRLVVGDGATSYQNMNYTSTATNVFRPFITDPELYVPRFENSTYATSGWTVDAGTEAINAMGDGSSASTVALPTFLGLVKNALCKHTNSIVKINNDLADKADKTIFNATSAGLTPAGGSGTTKYLRQDGSWEVPNSTTYGLATTELDGLLRKLDGTTFRFMRSDGRWATPDYPTLATKDNGGLVRQLYDDASTATRFLRGNNTWTEINDVFPSVLPRTDNYNASTNAYFTGTGAYNLYKELNNNLLSVGWVSSPIEYNTTDKKFTTVTVDLNSGTHSKPGYKPIAVVGFNTGNTDIYPNTFIVKNKEIGTGQELYIAVHNISQNSGTATSAGCNILWIKNSVS